MAARTSMADPRWMAASTLTVESNLRAPRTLMVDPKQMAALIMMVETKPIHG
jgi:hypothetical protein